MDRRQFLSIGTLPVVTACGGSGPVTPAPNFTQPTELKFHRVAAAAGEPPGFVRASLWVTTAIESNVTGNEWNHVCVIANYAPGGEHVAHYSQANSRSTGAIWAGVSEVCDETFGQKAAPMVAHEFDVWCSAEDSKDRLGVHIVVGDSRVYRDSGKSTVSKATSAIRISSNQSYASWKNGIEFTEMPEAVLSVPAGTERIAVRVGNKIKFIRLED
jgi:hypothetical protein